MSHDEYDDEPANALKEGDILAGRFELVSKLGLGSNGEVWKAVNLQLSVKVAIKIPRAATMRPDQIERFRREARSLCLVDSEHVLRFFEYNDAPTPFLVMELLKGEDLAARLKREKLLPLANVKNICRQLCKGLQAAHDVGVIHRDLKPANIYCLGEKIKIVDFGIMKLVQPAKDPTTQQVVVEHTELTRKNVIIGTPPYMSPEQCRLTEHDITFRSDLWSLSVLLYKALTGRLPFIADTDVALMRLILFEQAPRPSRIIPGLPEEVDQFFDKALAKDPSQRFASATEFGAAFDAIPESPPAAPGLGQPRGAAASNASETSTIQDAVSKLEAPVPPRSGQDERSDSEESVTIQQERLAAPQTPSSSPRLRRWLVVGVPVAALIAAFIVIIVRADVFSLRCDADRRDCDGKLINGCETDIRSVEHCGACGNRCMNEHGTAICAAGRCSPSCAPSFADCDGNPVNGCETNVLEDVERCGVCEKRCSVVAAAIAGPGMTMAIDDQPDGNVYLADPSHQTVWMVKKRGGPVTPVKPGGMPTSIVAEGNLVLWTDQETKSVMRLVDGGAPQKAAGSACKDCEMSGVASHGGKVYFAARNVLAGRTSLWDLEKRAKLLDSADSIGAQLGFAVGASGIYWITADTNGAGIVWSLSLAPFSQPKRIAGGLAKARALALHPSGTFVYWIGQGANGTTGTIVRVAKDGGSTQVLVTEAAEPRRLALDEKSVYWSSGDGMIKKLALDGSGNSIILAAGQAPEGIAVDQAYVYWLNVQGGQVMKIGK